MRTTKTQLFVVRVGDQFLTRGSAEQQHQPPLSTKLAVAQTFTTHGAAAKKLENLQTRKVCRGSFVGAAIIPATLSTD